jgi:hypothetical protein
MHGLMKGLMMRRPNCSFCKFMKARIPVEDGIIYYEQSVAYCSKGHLQHCRQRNCPRIFKLNTYYKHRYRYKAWETASRCPDFESMEDS